MTIATDHLALYGLTLQEAHDFVFAHLDDAGLILSVATQYGVTSAMLGEIAGGHSAAEVHGYFAGHGLDDSMLDGIGGTSGGLYQSAPADPALLIGAAAVPYDMGY